MSFREKINIDIMAEIAKMSPEDLSFFCYYNTFNEVPNAIEGEISDHIGAYDYILETFEISADNILRAEIKDKNGDYSVTGYLIFEPKQKFAFQFYRSNLVLYYSINANKEEVYAVLDTISSKFKNAIKTKIELGIVTSNVDGLYLKKIENDKIELSITKNYNNDFEKLHNNLLTSLNTLNNKGLILLHGKPGTGKTSYLRYLLQEVTEKNIIYITPEISNHLGEPNFLNFILSFPNSILIIEDAEALIKSREDGTNSLISNLLNLTDGLLSNCLHLQIICTFNTKLENIDKALMRKGRLICRYEFNELSVEKSNNLLAELYNNETITDKALTLAEIYNFNETCFEKENNKIGF